MTRLTAAIKVRLEPELRKELELAAEADKRTPSAVARLAIAEHLERRRSTKER